MLYMVTYPSLTLGLMVVINMEMAQQMCISFVWMDT